MVVRLGKQLALWGVEDEVWGDCGGGNRGGRLVGGEGTAGEVVDEVVVAVAADVALEGK